MSRETREQQSTKRTRIPVHEAQSNAFALINKDPNYVYRTVDEFENNKPALKRYLDAGYEFVQSGEGVTAVSKYETGEVTQDAAGVVAMGNGGTGKMYLMRQRREWYEEDQRAKQKEQDSRMASIHKGTNGMPDPRITIKVEN